MASDDQLHVVFGTGPIGLAVVDELSRTGRRVRAVNRSGRAGLPAGIEVVTGDASDGAFSRSACESAAVVYQCLNPPYTEWPRLFPSLQRGVLEGAAATGGKLVSIENLYAYGPTGGRPLTEDLPLAATGRKGRTRAAMTQELLGAHRAGRVRVAIGRASDYFGPRGLFSAMGERVFYPLLAGKKAQTMGKPDLPHTYTYLPDIAKGLVVVGERDEALGEAWHLPSPRTVTTREFIARVATEIGTDPQVQAMPKLLARAVSLFNSQVRELLEMWYEFDEPYVVDHSKFEHAFGSVATPLEEAIRETVTWFRANPR